MLKDYLLCANSVFRPLWESIESPGDILARQNFGRDGKPAQLKKFVLVTAVKLNGIFNVMSKCATVMVKNALENAEEKGVIINLSLGVPTQAKAAKVLTPAVAKASVIGMNLASWAIAGVYI